MNDLFKEGQVIPYLELRSQHIPTFLELRKVGKVVAISKNTVWWYSDTVN